MKEYRYRLGRRAGKCPSCGHRTFKFYVDTAAEGQPPLHPECGRCNRENSCGYHKPPSAFPDLRIDNTAVLTSAPKPLRPSIIDWKVKCQNISALQRNNLFRFMRTVFPADLVMEVFTSFGVTHATFCGNSTAFWLTDANGLLRSAKVMAYDALTGKRIKDSARPTVSYAHSLMKLEKFNYVPCFFGTHMAVRRLWYTVVVVESEKTALILEAALRAAKGGSYSPVASGGLSMLSFREGELADPAFRLHFLRGRDVVFIPDADGVDKWQAAAEALRPYCADVRVVDVRRPPFNLTGSDDIADWIVRSIR